MKTAAIALPVLSLFITASRADRGVRAAGSWKLPVQTGCLNRRVAEMLGIPRADLVERTSVRETTKVVESVRSGDAPQATARFPVKTQGESLQKAAAIG